MRKILTALLLVVAVCFAVAALISTPAAPADAAGGGIPSHCIYRCGCNGVVEQSCNGGPWVPATGPTPIRCPQVADC